jgi:mono/diheme cytochrome c family protein
MNCIVAILVSVLMLAGIANAAAEAVLTIAAGSKTMRLDAAALLARPDAADVAVAHDAAYGRAMVFRAVPLRALLAEVTDAMPSVLEARATDGFVSQLPRSRLEGAAVPWLAIEPPGQPWPKLVGKKVSAGPFYLVWLGAPVPAEQWPYAVAALTAVEPPATRWPALRVPASVPANAPAQRGQEVFATNCLPCHRLGGAGEGTQGPDLLRPMPATAYFTADGLRALIRNSRAVRVWPGQQMPGFSAETLPDTDLTAVIAYLRVLSGR